MLAAILLGALIVGVAAVGTSRLNVPYLWAAEVDDPGTDSDGDGLPDAIERSGVLTEAGDAFVTDPEVTDSDDDGLTDGEEVGALVPKGDASPVYRGFSDPNVADSDDDGVLDGDEYFLGTSPSTGDTDDDGLPDDAELDFGSDPLVDNADRDDYSDGEERERSSAPMAYDESGWRARLSTALTVLKIALSGADKLTGGGKLSAAAKAIDIAKGAGMAAPVIWHALGNWDWSDIDTELRDAVFGDDIDQLGETLEGGQSSYVAYVGRAPDGAIVFVGVTDDFEQLTANHGGLSELSAIGGSDELPLGQARALAEAVIGGLHDRMSDNELANSRHVIDPANNLYAPAMRWGLVQLERAEFEW